MLWWVVTLSFFALRVLPGDALTAQLTVNGGSPQFIDAQRAALGLDEPLLVQYLDYLSGLLSGDLGMSLRDGRPITAILSTAIAATLSIAVPALVLTLVLGMAAAIVGTSALPWGLSTAVRFTSNAAVSAPIYLTAMLAVLIFSLGLGWLPPSGYGSGVYLVLPTLVLGFHTSGAVARVLMPGLSAARSAAYLRTARAKGLRPARIVLWHHLRVALIPVVAVTALQSGFLLSGTVIVETVFVRPGLGRTLLDAVLSRDYPVVQGAVLLFAVLYIMLNTLADLLYPLLDPRLRTELV